MNPKHNRPDSDAQRRRLENLKNQIKALGGIGGSRPGFEESNPEFMIQFYEEVLAEEERINPRRDRPGEN